MDNFFDRLSNERIEMESQSSHQVLEFIQNMYVGQEDGDTEFAGDFGITVRQASNILDSVQECELGTEQQSQVLEGIQNAIDSDKERARVIIKNRIKQSQKQNNKRIQRRQLKAAYKKRVNKLKRVLKRKTRN